MPGCGTYNGTSETPSPTGALPWVGLHVRQRDVEDAVPYGRGSNTVAETFVNAAGEADRPVCESCRGTSGTPSPTGL